MAVLHNLSSSRLLSHTSKEYTLIHHWDADDWTVGTNWIDRVKGLAFARSGNPIKSDGLIGCCRQYGYFSLNANNATHGINMGSEWLVEVECMIEDVTLSDARQIQTAVDFGSVASASHAFCVGVSRREAFFNPKFTGNNSAPLYSQVFDFNPFYDKVVKIAIGTKEVGSDTMLPFYMLEGDIKYSPNTLTKQQALFNRNFSLPMVYVGANSSSVGGNTYDNTNQYKFIKSIKIYKDSEFI